MSRFATIATFNYPHEATILKSKLEAEGVRCILKDAYTAQVDNFYSLAIGGVKLQVAENDFEQAQIIYNTMDFYNESDSKYSIAIGKIISKVDQLFSFTRKWIYELEGFEISTDVRKKFFNILIIGIVLTILYFTLFST